MPGAWRSAPKEPPRQDQELGLDPMGQKLLTGSLQVDWRIHKHFLNTFRLDICFLLDLLPPLPTILYLNPALYLQSP